MANRPQVPTAAVATVGVRDEVIWAVRKDGREAHAVVRVLPHARRELRVIVTKDGAEESVWTQA